jgi:hypothetical protein
MRSSEIIISLVMGAVLFSLSKLYMGGSNSSLTTSLMSQSSAVETEEQLQKQVSELMSVKEMLQLSIEELKLSHENSARLKAIEVAHNMIEQKRTSSGAIGSSSSSSSYINQQVAEAAAAAAAATPIQPPQTKPKQSAINWCGQAAKLFKLVEPVGLQQQFGNMKEPKYREAWLAHGCDAIVFSSMTPAIPQLQQPLQPQPQQQQQQQLALVMPQSSYSQVQQSVGSGQNSFMYLNDNSGRPRRVIKVS